MITDAFRKLYGNGVVFANLRGQRKVPYLSDAERHARRDARIRSIVKYAAETVPFYRDWFRSENLTPDQIRTPADLARLPSIDKEIVRAEGDRFLSTSRRAKTSLVIKTSGSTNRSIDFHHDRNGLLANIAFGERERAAMKPALKGKKKYTETYIYNPGTTTDVVLDFYRQWTYIPVRPNRLVIPIADPVESQVESVNRFQPDILYSLGSYLEVLYRTIKFRKLRMHRPRLLMSIGDSPTPEGQQFIADEFDIPMLSHYNAGEALKIGYTCRQQSGFHLHDDLCHLRIVDPEGNPVPDGQDGEIVLSNFVNRAHVLLNYRMGDLAHFTADPCPCGRTQPMISALQGRLADIIHLPSGKLVHAAQLSRIFRDFAGVLQNQIIQHEPLRFELKLHAVDRPTYDRHLPKILDRLHEVFGQDALIEPTPHEFPHPKTHAKFRPVISLCNPARSP
jgi:phenylacetate-CoA ligase